MVSMELVSDVWILFFGSQPFPKALKADDIQALKTKFGLPADQSFYVPQATYDAYAEIAKRGAALEAEWNSLLTSYGQKYPKEHAELTRRIAGELPEKWQQSLPVYKPSDSAVASRKLSEIVLTAITPVLPELFGGSADLTGSNLTKVKGTTDFQPPSTGLGNYAGTYIRFGVREHGMGAIANGIAAYGGIIPFVATFLVITFRTVTREVSKLCILELCFVRSRRYEVICPQWSPSYLGWYVVTLHFSPRISH